MLDIRKAKTSVAFEYELPTDRAIQAQALDYSTGEWYVSQGKTSGAVEDALVTKGAPADSKGFIKRISTMTCIDGGHPSTLAFLRRNGVAGVVINYHNVLSWAAYRDGKVTKADAEPIFTEVTTNPDSFAHIDHESKTVCIRRGYTYNLYELNGDKAGKKIGKTISDVNNVGPGQGYFTMKTSDGFILLSMFGFGHDHQKQIIDVRSFTTGKQLYLADGRVLPAKYTLQEPESGFVLNGVPYLGMSAKGTGIPKAGLAIKFGVPSQLPVNFPDEAFYKETVSVFGAIDRKAFDIRLKELKAEVVALVPNIYLMPEDAQVATLSVAWKAGSEAFDSTSSHYWPNLTPALLQDDFWTAVTHCGVANSPLQNARNKVLFAQAAKTELLQISDAYKGVDVTIASSAIAFPDSKKFNESAFWVQAMLRELGHYQLRVDGLFGTKSLDAYKQFIAAKQLTTKTVSATLEELSKQTYKLKVLK